MQNSIKISISEISAKVVLLPEEKRSHPNLLANASVTLRGDVGGYLTITGFTIWKSKYANSNMKNEDLSIQVPQKKNFKYCLFDEILWASVKKLIMDAYLYEDVPIIN